MPVCRRKRVTSWETLHPSTFNDHSSELGTFGDGHGSLYSRASARRFSMDALRLVRRRSSRFFIRLRTLKRPTPSVSTDGATSPKKSILRPSTPTRKRRFWKSSPQERPKENIPVARPSVATVESVTAAKVYFETHFNALLSEKPSPRSIRRKKFEQEIWQIASSNAEREDARKRWAQSETDHLRQMRVLKATSLARHEVKGISIAGYDVVRVLGKGSFGVVRLVTEKSNAQQPTTPGTDSSCGGDLSRNDTASEPTHRKLTEPKKEVYAMKKGGLLDYRDRTERRKLARSVVGTSQYMAPEVIMGQPYDGRCDWWSIGIVLYEVGQTTLAYKQLLMSFRSEADHNPRQGGVKVAGNGECA
ncbi:hypothetical protein M8818_004701 [Zalaria obscura]|uniref:Uncharacterized protein n=1 Tax=Zalaria obscura TaxID=2024903 RepID=A0ACC3SCN8_9PEZI